MFHTLWYEGAVHKLGSVGGTWFDHSFIYVGLLQEDGTLKKYVSHIETEEDDSSLEVLSRVLIGKSEKERDVYEVKIAFESSMINMDDETDIIYVKNGTATLKIANFSQDAGK